MTTDSQPAVLVGAATQLNSQEARNGRIHNIINRYIRHHANTFPLPLIATQTLNQH